jgi:hypothetical protein
MATTEQPKSLSETEKLAATLAALEAERERRMSAGAWSKGTRPRLMVLPADGETLQAAQQREVYRYLAEHPDAPKAVAAYDWLAVEVVDPPPTVETHPYAPDHIDAVDVTPFRPPMPSPPPPAARSLPPPPGSVDPRSVNIPARIHGAEQRRVRNFADDTWGDPSDWPIRYPRGNRNGW